MQPSLLVYHERTPLQDPRLGISQTITQALAPNQSLALTHNEIPALQISVTDDMTNTVTVTSSTETANTETANTHTDGADASLQAVPATATAAGTARVQVTPPTAADPTDQPHGPYKLHLPIGRRD